MRLIDADAFIEENAEIIDCEIDHPKYQDTLRELIDEAPTVERPHGEWETKTIINNRTGEKEIYSFCPCCGASYPKKEGGEAE